MVKSVWNKQVSGIRDQGSECIISAIILAAGKGSRIGQPKWQLPYQSGTFLSSIIAKLQQAHIEQIVCVVSADSVPKIDNVAITINPYPARGMISSIFYGIQAIAKCDGYLIMPVDHPFIESATIEKLYATFLPNKNAVIRPKYQEQIGHPIIIPSKIAQLIPLDAYQGGLNQLLKDNNTKVCDIIVADKGVSKNINTKEDLTDE
jgi:molybdenum cofactor cytidylyltransferase